MLLNFQYNCINNIYSNSNNGGAIIDATFLYENESLPNWSHLFNYISVSDIYGIGPIISLTQNSEINHPLEFQFSNYTTVHNTFDGEEGNVGTIRIRNFYAKINQCHFDNLYSHNANIYLVDTTSFDDNSPTELHHCNIINCKETQSGSGTINVQGGNAKIYEVSFSNNQCYLGLIYSSAQNLIVGQLYIHNNNNNRIVQNNGQEYSTFSPFIYPTFRIYSLTFFNTNEKCKFIPLSTITPKATYNYTENHTPFKLFPRYKIRH